MPRTKKAPYGICPSLVQHSLASYADAGSERFCNQAITIPGLDHYRCAGCEGWKSTAKAARKLNTS